MASKAVQAPVAWQLQPQILILCFCHRSCSLFILCLKQQPENAQYIAQDLGDTVIQAERCWIDCIPHGTQKRGVVPVPPASQYTTLSHSRRKRLCVWYYGTSIGQTTILGLSVIFEVVTEFEQAFLCSRRRCPSRDGCLIGHEHVGVAHNLMCVST